MVCVCVCVCVSEKWVSDVSGDGLRKQDFKYLYILSVKKLGKKQISFLK